MQLFKQNHKFSILNCASDDGRIIPEGSMVNMNFFILFRDPEYFPRPTNFEPDRFINGTLNDKIADKSNSFAYIPFSAGTRNCIGQKFAMLEMKSVISNILRNFELLPMGDEPDLRMELVLRTKNGVQLGLKPRMYDWTLHESVGMLPIPINY